jgi:uracil-DNA glycosylase family 4
MHTKPSSREIMACEPWLEEELSALHPKLLVCLGATAARALFGNSFRASGFPRGSKVRQQFFADLKRVALRFRS